MSGVDFLSSTPIVQVNISADPNEETVANASCAFELRNGILLIRSQDGSINFSTQIGEKKHFISQLDRVLRELHAANLNGDHPERTEFFFEGVGKEASLTIEQFCESEDPFEVTLTIEPNDGGHRLWLAIAEGDLQKLVQAFSA